ncbi:MAG: glutathione S-transferase [SAR86 cluster bacterium]|nr:glutathione S-transferase [SAR86 cluster bacterium]
MLSGFQNNVVEETSDEWVLYHNNFSLCSRKVRFCLEELGFNFRSQHIDLIETGKYEVASSKYLKINPGATVPVLLHQGRPIYESHKQIYYLIEQSLDKKNILPSASDERLIMDYWVEKSSLVGNPLKNQDKYAGNCCGPLTFPLFVTMIKYVSIKEIFKGLKSHPMKERVIIFFIFKILGLKIFSLPFPFTKLLKSSFSNLNIHLCDLENHLEDKKTPWIVGLDLTLADISWAAILHRLHECEWGNMLLSDKPNIKNYYSNLIIKDAFKKAFDSPTHPILLKGIKDLKDALNNKSPITKLHNQIRNKINES